MYEGSYYSTASFTISGSGNLTDEFHAGRLVEYATITGSVTTSGVWTEDVTNSGVTTSGVLISGSITQDYYEYCYGIVETSAYTASGTGSGTSTINLTPESETVTSGSVLYIKYGPGDVGQDDTFPSSAVPLEIYQLGYYPINYNIVYQLPTTLSGINLTEGEKLATIEYYADATPDIYNTGTGAGEVYRDTISGATNFRNIKAGSNIRITQDGLDITISGTAISGSLTNHDQLNNLTYASSGHTGFAPTVHTHTESDITDLGDYVTDTEMTTISGDIVAQKYTDEEAQDAVGTIMSGTGTITVTYNDGTPSITISGSDSGSGTVGDVNLSTDHSYYTSTGNVRTVTISGSPSFGQPLYVNSDFAYELADADAESTMACRGIYIDNNQILLRGIIRDDSWGWSAGDIYVSTAVGTLTQTPPSGSGDVVQVLGHATASGKAEFDCMRDYAVIV